MCRREAVWQNLSFAPQESRKYPKLGPHEEVPTPQDVILFGTVFVVVIQMT